MNLELLKRVADDGVAKYKAFLELQEAIAGADSTSQYLNEMQAKVAAAKALVTDNEEAAKQSQALAANAKMQTDAVLKELAKIKEDAAAKHSADMARLASEANQINAKINELRGRLSAQDQQVQDAVVTEKARLDGEFKKLSDDQSFRIAQLQAVEQQWQDKLSAAKLAFDQFISKLPK